MLTGRSAERRAPRPGHTRRWFGAVVCATALVATACGSDSNSSSSTDAAATTAAAGASTTAAAGASTTAAAGGDAMSAAKANVEKALVRPTKIEVTEPVGATIPKGKTIDWIQCSIPACTQLGTALKEATDTLGWTLNTIDGGITPETIANAWAKAAANKHDAVIASGFPRSIFEQSLQELKAANIPVIDIDVTDPAENGITAVIQGADDYPPLGALQADWVLSQGGEDSHVLRVTTSAFPVVGLSTQGFTDEY
jgi:ribose transport system substrate-binding protein